MRLGTSAGSSPHSDSIPLEDDSERKKRKSMKYLEYEVLEAIPGKIRAVREAYGKKKASKHLALLAMHVCLSGPFVSGFIVSTNRFRQCEWKRRFSFGEPTSTAGWNRIGFKRLARLT
jgi:hypothetical protein